MPPIRTAWITPRPGIQTTTLVHVCKPHSAQLAHTMSQFWLNVGLVVKAALSPLAAKGSRRSISCVCAGCPCACCAVEGSMALMSPVRSDCCCRSTSSFMSASLANICATCCSCLKRRSSCMTLLHCDIGCTRPQNGATELVTHTKARSLTRPPAREQESVPRGHRQWVAPFVPFPAPRTAPRRWRRLGARPSGGVAAQASHF